MFDCIFKSHSQIKACQVLGTLNVSLSVKRIILENETFGCFLSKTYKNL